MWGARSVDDTSADTPAPPYGFTHLGHFQHTCAFFNGATLNVSAKILDTCLTFLMS